jgi:hypothetical protein
MKFHNIQSNKNVNMELEPLFFWNYVLEWEVIF